MRTVYVETTIPSFYFETRSSPQAVAWRDANRRWWSRSGGRYRLVTSSFVIGELDLAPEPKRSESLALMGRLEVLDDPDELGDVIEFYLQHKLMPRDAAGDAAHLAHASLAGVDFLVTWNLAHLANANKFRQTEVLNARLGLATPLMVTPYALLSEDGDE